MQLDTSKGGRRIFESGTASNLSISWCEGDEIGDARQEEELCGGEKGKKLCALEEEVEAEFNDHVNLIDEMRGELI